jgi:hypothetical protein
MDHCWGLIFTPFQILSSKVATTEKISCTLGDRTVVFRYDDAGDGAAHSGAGYHRVALVTQVEQGSQ